MEVELRATVYRTRAPSAMRLAASFGVVGLAIALDRVVHIGWVGWLAVIATAIPMAWRDRARKRSVVASAAGLKLDDETLPRASLANAMWRVEDGRVWLSVELRDEGVVQMVVPSTKHAEKIAKALGLDDSKSALELRLLKQAGGGLFTAFMAASVAGLYFGATYWRGHFSAVFTTFIVSLIALAFVHTELRKVRVVAGIDGISVADRRGRSQFLSYADIELVHSAGRDVVVSLKSGGALRFDATTGRKSKSSNTRARTIAERMERARRAWAETPEPPEVLTTLGHGAFRQSHTPREVLWDALRNAKTRVSDRVVAAAALRQQGAEDDLARIRVEVDRCASPAREHVRAVLDADDERLDDVVDDLARR